MEDGNIEWINSIRKEIDKFSSTINSETFQKNLQVENYQHFLNGARFLNNKFKYTLFELCDYEDLEEVHLSIEAINYEIRDFLDEDNNVHLYEAKSKLIKASNNFAKLPSLIVDEDSNYYGLFADFEKTLRAKRNKIEKDLEANQEKLNTFSDTLEQNIKIFKDLQKSFADKEVEISNIDKSFKNDFDIFEKNSSKKIDDLLEEHNKLYNGFIELKNNDTESFITQLKEKLQEGKKLVNLIGDVTITGNYQKNANAHRIDANLWRYIAIGCMGIFALLLIFTIYDVNSENYDFTKSLLRIICAIALSYPATYAARESSKHRRLETENRQAELELTAINPFIEFLPEKSQQKIKEDLVAKYFNGNFKHSDFDKNLDEEVSISALERIIKALSSIKDKK